MSEATGKGITVYAAVVSTLCDTIHPPTVSPSAGLPVLAQRLSDP